MSARFSHAKRVIEAAEDCGRCAPRLPARREDVTSLAYLVDNHSCGARSGWWEGCGERTQKPN